MNLKQEQKIIRLSMIVSIVAGMSWIGMWATSEPAISSSANLGTEIVFSGFGQINLYNPENVGLFSTNMYQDTSLGFQIAKPGGNWEIHPVLDELNSEELSSLQTKGFLDGVYVEQNHNKQFIITVFDIKKENFSLHEYVDTQITLMESENIQLSFEQVSPEDNWALFAVESSDNQYGEQLLFLKENRLYMLQYSGDSPQTLTLEQKNDFRLIMDSFEVI